MANRRSKGNAGDDGGVEEPDLVPMMNLNFVLIAALLSMTVNVNLGLISVQAPSLGGGGGSAAEKPEDKKPKLNLTIFITNKGYDIAASGATLNGATDGRPGEALIPMKPNDKGEMDYNYESLNKKLLEIKKNFPLEDNVIITADPRVIYERVVETMDAARESGDGEELFPAVAFSAGIVG